VTAEQHEHIYPDATPENHYGEAPGSEPTGLELVPGMARVAASAWWHAGVWAAGTYVNTGRKLAGVVLHPESGVELARDVSTETGRVVRAVLEATELEQRLDGTPGAQLVRRLSGWLPAPGPAKSQTPQAPERSSGSAGKPMAADRLRDGGEDLLRRSRDVRYEVDAHPAYERILSELAPDEGRVLRLMVLDGPQASVDVRTGGPLGLFNSRLIAPGLTMIGARAGVRYPERVPSYLNNLFRLGLIWFSHETLRNHKRYQVLEAQPDVLAAIHSVTAAKVVRRSIHLTPFGEDFCRVCLSDMAAELAALPPHSAPKSAEKSPQPPTELLDG
jgi:hypothetical protein